MSRPLQRELAQGGLADVVHLVHLDVFDAPVRSDSMLLANSQRKKKATAKAPAARWHVSSITDWRYSESEHAATVLFNSPMRPDWFEVEWESRAGGRKEITWEPIGNITGGYASPLVQEFIRTKYLQPAAADGVRAAAVASAPAGPAARARVEGRASAGVKRALSPSDSKHRTAMLQIKHRRLRAAARERRYDISPPPQQPAAAAAPQQPATSAAGLPNAAQNASVAPTLVATLFRRSANSPLSESAAGVEASALLHRSRSSASLRTAGKQHQASPVATFAARTLSASTHATMQLAYTSDAEAGN
jgi:hypothetical protein